MRNIHSKGIINNLKKEKEREKKNQKKTNLNETFLIIIRSIGVLSSFLISNFFVIISYNNMIKSKLMRMALNEKINEKIKT